MKIKKISASHQNSNKLFLKINFLLKDQSPAWELRANPLFSKRIIILKIKIKLNIILNIIFIKILIFVFKIKFEAHEKFP